MQFEVLSNKLKGSQPSTSVHTGIQPEQKSSTPNGGLGILSASTKSSNQFAKFRSAIKST